MSTQQSSGSSDSTEYRARAEEKRMLPCELSSVRTTERRDPNDDESAILGVSALNTRAGRARVAGVVTHVEEKSGTAVEVVIATQNDSLSLYANQYSEVSTPDLMRIEAPQPVIITARPRTYSPENSQAVLSSPKIESCERTTMEKVHAERAKAANQTIKRAEEAEALLEDYIPVENQEDVDWDNMNPDAQVFGDVYGENTRFDTPSPAEFTHLAEEAQIKARCNVMGESREQAEYVIRGIIPSDTEWALEILDVYGPAIETLSDEFSSVEEMVEVDDLTEFKNVGEATAETINELRSDDVTII